MVGEINKTKHAHKKGVNVVGNKKNYSVNVFLMVPVTLACHIAVLKCMKDCLFPQTLVQDDR